ncbi:MAG TPA: four helix bundle protein [Thermoanaerobaculia bacterium]|nr:four helix bundle protein [Thermoanaerobaculia bacterium]
MSLKDRTRNFALQVIQIADVLPRQRTADIIARQLIKAGTSPGAHFREATRARSKSEYVAKLNGGLMELEETLYWLEIAEASTLISASVASELQEETDALIAIFVSLINKWKKR